MQVSCSKSAALCLKVKQQVDRLQNVLCYRLCKTSVTTETVVEETLQDIYKIYMHHNWASSIHWLLLVNIYCCAGLQALVFSCDEASGNYQPHIYSSHVFTLGQNLLC